MRTHVPRTNLTDCLRLFKEKNLVLFSNYIILLDVWSETNRLLYHCHVIARVISKCSTGQRTAGAFIEILEGRTLKRIPSPFGPSHPERRTYGMSSKPVCSLRNLVDCENKRNFAIGKDADINKTYSRIPRERFVINL